MSDTVPILTEKTMHFGFGDHVLMPLTLGVCSLAFIGLGLYALSRKRPFILNERWMLALVVVAMLPSMFWQFSLFFSDVPSRRGGFDLIALISLTMTIVMLGYMALQLRGYMVLGTTLDSFREALLAALSKLDLKAEESLSSIRLPTVPAEIQVAVYGWMGTAQLRLRSGGRPGLLADVAKSMTTYFDSAQVKTNMVSAIFYLIVGVLMSVMVVTMMVVF